MTEGISRLAKCEEAEHTWAYVSIPNTSVTQKSPRQAGFQNLDDETILRLLVVTQSRAYLGVCEHLRRKADAEIARQANFS